MSVVAEIEFNGEKIGVKYSVPALKMIFQKLDKLSFLSADVYDEVSLAQIIYAGHVQYCIPKEIIPKFSFEQVYETIINNTGNADEMRKAVVAFTEGCKSLYEQLKPDEKKSQLTGKKLKKQPMGNSV